MSEFGDVTDAISAKRSEIKQNGKGSSHSATVAFHVSEDIDLLALKRKSKEFGVTINELFMGACVSAYSKLDIPEEMRPSQFNTETAFGLWNR